MARKRSWSGCAKRRPQRRLRPRRRGRRPRQRRPKERRRPKMTTAPMTSGFQGGPRSGVFVLQRGPAGAGGAAPWMRACAADGLIKADTILGVSGRFRGSRVVARAPAPAAMGRIVAVARARAQGQLCHRAIGCCAARMRSRRTAQTLRLDLCSSADRSGASGLGQADWGLCSQAGPRVARAPWERGSGRKRGRCADVG